MMQYDANTTARRSAQGNPNTNYNYYHCKVVSCIYAQEEEGTWYVGPNWMNVEKLPTYLPTYLALPRIVLFLLLLFT